MGPSSKGLPLHLHLSTCLGCIPKANDLVCSMRFMSIMDRWSVPGKICKQAELGSNTTLPPLHVEESCGKGAWEPFPAHLGSTTLHISPSTEIFVMWVFFFPFSQEHMQCVQRKLVGWSGGWGQLFVTWANTSILIGGHLTVSSSMVVFFPVDFNLSWGEIGVSLAGKESISWKVKYIFSKSLGILWSV